MIKLGAAGTRINLGIAKLRVATDGEQSIVVDQFSQVPLQLHHPLYLDGATFPTVYLKTPSSGLLGGDVHEIEVQIGENSQLEMRTQAATLAYPGSSSLSIYIDVASGGKLTFLPHALILGANSEVTQKVKIALGAGASLKYSDTWCAGRIAMKEAWQFARYDYCLEIFKLGILSYRERWILTPETKPLSHPLICGQFTHFSSLYNFGSAANASEANVAEADVSWEDSQVWHMERAGDHITRRCAKAR